MFFLSFSKLFEQKKLIDHKEKIQYKDCIDPETEQESTLRDDRCENTPSHYKLFYVVRNQIQQVWII